MTSGEWASGSRWADDKPRENLSADSVSLIHSGACGAFVHGLEDEFLGKLITSCLQEFFFQLMVSTR